jgi:hypothetical protein
MRVWGAKRHEPSQAAGPRHPGAIVQRWHPRRTGDPARRGRRPSVPIANENRLVAADALGTPRKITKSTVLLSMFAGEGYSPAAANGIRLPAGGRHDAAPPSAPRRCSAAG